MDLLWLVNLAVRVFLLVRLFWLGQYREWPYLTGLFFVSVCQSILLMQFKPGTTAYSEAWLITEPIYLIVEVLAALEVFRNASREFPMMKSSQKLLLFISALAFAISAVTLFGDARVALSRSLLSLLIFLTILNRYLTTALAIGMVIAWLFFRPYATRTPRETKLNLSCMVGWYLLLSASFWLHIIGDRETQKLASNILLASDAVLIFVWALLMRKPTYQPILVQESDEFDRLDNEYRSNMGNVKAALKRLRRRG